MAGEEFERRLIGLLNALVFAIEEMGFAIALIYTFNAALCLVIELHMIAVLKALGVPVTYEAVLRLPPWFAALVWFAVAFGAIYVLTLFYLHRLRKRIASLRRGAAPSPQ